MAAMYYNENSNRPQATNKDGTLRYRLATKRGREKALADPVLVDATYVYVGVFFAEVERLLIEPTGVQVAEIADNPPSVWSQKPRPTKEDAIALRGQYTRFRSESQLD